MMKLFAAAATFAAVASIGFAANASTLYSAPGATGAMATDTSFSDTFFAAGGPANASFVIDGFNSLDGQNFYEDDFSLSLNGAAILTGTFNLGGGGADVVYSAPTGASAVNVSGNGLNVTWAGGQVDVSTPLSLVNGPNTLTFAYTSLSDPSHAGFQGLGDEGWGIEQVSVTSPGGVPETSTWAMVVLGMGGIGYGLRRERQQRVLA